MARVRPGEDPLVCPGHGWQDTPGQWSLRKSTPKEGEGGEIWLPPRCGRSGQTKQKIWRNVNGRLAVNNRMVDGAKFQLIEAYSRFRVSQELQSE
ncbi:hypothetical protein J6590_064872 [Homalodisca vitripennis]|nr:hypothetical protein J6590_064872 [Homalodisca vitripennis]